MSEQEVSQGGVDWSRYRAEERSLQLEAKLAVWDSRQEQQEGRGRKGLGNCIQTVRKLKR